MRTQIACRPGAAALTTRCSAPSARRAAGARLVVRAEENRVVREYREDEDKVIVAGQGPPAEGAPAADPSSQFVDDLPEIPRTEMSAEMKAKLRNEYYGLGGSPNKPMNSNYFLNIILIISFLAIISYALGYLN